MHTISINKSHKAYINSIFSQSSTIGKCLLKYSDKIATHAKITLDEDVALSQSFEIGGITNRNLSISILTRMLHSLISEHDYYIVLYNSCALRSDQIVEQYSWPIFCGNDVYHIIPPYASLADIRQGIIEAETGLSLLGIVVSSRNFSLPSGCACVTENQIEAWTNIAEFIIVGVYDGEAYLVCDKKQ